MRRMVVVLVIVGLCVNTAAALDGSGTQQAPWRIESLADFDEFADDPNYWAGYTRLETDVNLAGRTYTTAVIALDKSRSDGFQGTPFTGVFEGDGHKIAGLKPVKNTAKMAVPPVKVVRNIAAYMLQFWLFVMYFAGKWKGQNSAYVFSHINDSVVS